MFNKLELDVMQTGELIEAANLAVKYRIPAMIVHPMIVSEALMARGRAQGKYKIIIPVDWPKGETYGMTKMRGLSTDALDCDGFEILVTPGKNHVDTKKEMAIITEFVKHHLSELVEVRFVLNIFSRSEDDIKTILQAISEVRTPAYIRTDHQLKLQINKASVDTHNNAIDMIIQHVRAPIKISGNITSVRTVTSCSKAARFAVNVLQAKAIIKEYNSHPEELKELLIDTKHEPATQNSL